MNFRFNKFKLRASTSNTDAVSFKEDAPMPSCESYNISISALPSAQVSAIPPLQISFSRLEELRSDREETQVLDMARRARRQWMADNPY